MKHPDESAVLDLAQKTLTEGYLKTLANFIKKNYPGSSEKLLPEFREIYKKKFKVTK